MPTAEPAYTGPRPKAAPSRCLVPRQSPLSLVAVYFLLASLCGCSIFSSAAWNTGKFFAKSASAAKDTLTSKTLHYLGDSELKYYQDVASQIDYTQVDQEANHQAIASEPPRRIRHPREDDILDITLSEAIQRALTNCEVIRSRGQFLSPSNVLYNSPQQVNSVYDPAIQGSGITFGNRGVDAALADFDPNLTFNSTWGRNEQIQNNRFTGQGLPAGATLIAETANVQAQLQKQFATGGTFSVGHTVNYQLNNVPAFQRLFGSVYTGNVQAQFTQPLLAGNGVEFNRIAGPINNNPQRVSGVSQGVVIARINNDISIADFEASVRNLLKDVEDLYWELSLAYRAYDAEIVARNSNLEVWRKAKVRFEEGQRTTSDEAQAREAFFESRSRAEEALTRIYTTEGELRRLLGMPVNDGYILRPVDEPTTAEFLPDWHISLAEALTNRVEIRRQKWLVKSLELQMKAAKTLVRPRLDFISAYQINMLGDKLWSPTDNDQFNTPEGLNSAYGTLTQGNQTGWNLGFQFSMPLGLRTAHSQVRNLELQLAKARAVLGVQELEVSHELGRAFQEVDRAYQTAQTNFNRRRAAELRVQVEQNKVNVGIQDPEKGNTVDLLLRAQVSLAQAQVAYYSSLVAYNQAIVALHYRKGSLLEFDNITLAESNWDPQAYILALRRAWSRSHALDAGHLLRTEPAEFSTPQPLKLLMPAGAAPAMNPPGTPAIQMGPDMPLPPTPEPSPAPTPDSQAPPAPVPSPQNPGDNNTMTWRTAGPETRAAESPQFTRRAELPLR